jgi:hypothetical protein
VADLMIPASTDSERMGVEVGVEVGVEEGHLQILHISSKNQVNLFVTFDRDDNAIFIPR